MVLRVAGVDLHYDTHGTGEPLLWLHGGLGHGADWKYIFTDAPPGYQLIAPDLRGHGESTGSSPVYSFKQSALDMFALLDHFQVDRIKVIGLSGGGIAALHMATLQPSRIAAMVIVSAPPRFPPQAQAIQRSYSEATLTNAQQSRLHEVHRRDGQIDMLFAQIHAMADAGDPNFTASELATITAETLIVFGDRDPLYPISLAVELRESIPRSYLWVVPNRGHGPVFGAAAPLFVDTVLRFLRGDFQSTGG